MRNGDSTPPSESGEALVRGLGITKGLKVLDLGCGDGTTALPAARLGADVLGVNIASNLVEAGNGRARAEGVFAAQIVAVEIPLFAFLAYTSLRYMETRARRDGKLI